jgi:predicted ATPase
MTAIKHGMGIGKTMILAKFYLNLCSQGKKKVLLLVPVHKHKQTNKKVENTTFHPE